MSDANDIGDEATLAGLGPAVAPAAAAVMFGRYLVISILGHGAMGEVHVAYDPDLDRKVALKRVRIEDRTRDDRRARLLQEAQAMAKIRHPNVVAVYDVGQLDQEVFIAMELVDGETLRAWMQRAHPPLAIIEVFLQAARGLSAAHETGLVHRDFKPDNAMVDRSGRVQVLDFGLAASMERPRTATPRGGTTTSTTETHALAGTPAYMAPEQYAGEPAQAHSDQFAWCVALFEALHGRRPFRGETLPALAHAICSGTLTEPERLRGLSRRLDRAIRRGLATRAEDRWPNMRALIDELEAGLAAERWGRRRWLVVGLVGAAAVVAAIILRVDSPTCDTASAPVDAVWNAPDRDALAQRFVDAPLPLGRMVWPTVEAALDARATDARAAYRDACERAASGRADQVELADRQRVCLHEQMQAFGDALEVLALADAEVIEHASAMIDALPSTEACTSPEVVSVRDAALRERVRRVASVAASLLAASKPALAKQRLDEAFALPEFTADFAAVAELGVLSAQAERDLGHDDAGVARIEQAYLAARGADSRALTLAAARAYVDRYTERREPAPAQQWIGRARVEAQALGDSRALAKLEGDEALVLSHLGDFHGAIAHADAALEQLTALGLSESRDAYRVLSNQGGFYFQQRRYDRALACKRAAHQGFERILGRGHPELAKLFADLGTIASATGDYDQAQQHLEQALAMLEGAFDEPHPRIGDVLASLAGLEARRQRNALAMAYSERALANLVPTRGEESAAVALVLNNHAIVLQAAGRHAEAVAALRRSVSIKEQILEPDHPDLALAYLNLAELRGKDDEPEAVRALLRKALAIREARDEPQALANVQAVFAAWLVDQGEYEPARILAEQVLASPASEPTSRVAAGYALARGTTGETRRAHARAALAIVTEYPSSLLPALAVLAAP